MSVDEVAVAALKKGMGQRALARLNRRAELRRAGKSDADIEGMVDGAIQQMRSR